MAFLVVLYEEHVSAVLDSGNYHHMYIARSLISLQVLDVCKHPKVAISLRILITCCLL